MRKTGSNLRILIDGKGVAAAKDCTFHVAVQTEDATTKDSTGAWTEDEVTTKSWDVSGNALVVFEADTAEVAEDFLDNICDSNELLEIEFTETNGEKNRVKVTQSPVIYRKGKALLNDFSLQAASGQKPTFSYQLKGQGPLSKTQA